MIKDNKISNGVKLLILTQKVDINDDVLGFMHDWIAEFAGRCEKVTIICLQKGEYNLPQNVKVLSLGKEAGESKTKYLVNFYKFIWQERKNYDTVFVHMNPEYIVLGGCLWRLWRKKIFMWYLHKQVDWKLRSAVWLANGIFTASPASFRLPTRKLMIMGHGINVEKFRIRPSKLKTEEFKIVSTGRISPVKGYEELIEAVKLITAEGKDSEIRVEIMGGPGTPEQAGYLEKLKKMVGNYGLTKIVNFIGPVPNYKVAEKLATADLFVQMSRTGSLDKALLEAMAVGLPVISCNDSAAEIFTDKFPGLLYSPGNCQELAWRIGAIYNLGLADRQELGRKLRQIVVQKHSMDALIKNIVKNISYGK